MYLLALVMILGYGMRSASDACANSAQPGSAQAVVRGVVKESLMNGRQSITEGIKGVAMEVNPQFSAWAKVFSGCDGGDIGNSRNRSIWVCGIEWGGGDSSAAYLASEYARYPQLLEPPSGYNNWQTYLGEPYNRQAIKLLAAVAGQNVGAYADFAEQARPFVAGASGYFKINLYPIGFKNTDGNRWTAELFAPTGFANKEQYFDWCREHRLPVLREWAAKYCPALIICTGITHKQDFFAAFGDRGMALKTEVIDSLELNYGFNQQGTMVAVIPFITGTSKGLNRDSSIQNFGARIAAIMRASAGKF
jgi:hypothetical protein